MLNALFHRKLKKGGHILPTLTVAVILIYLSGCSTTNNYKVLSFFFDGVPDPAKDTTSLSNDSLRSLDTAVFAQNSISKQTPQMVVHSPYQDRQCNSCHDQSRMGKLLKSPPGLCYQCHEDFSSKYQVLHGPVGGGQCTQCHSPHSSTNADLLIRTGQSLCFYCHDSNQVMESTAHLEINDANCTECHNPHGGKDRTFLR
jgi:predicted CXXCH cytochrome family protein